MYKNAANFIPIRPARLISATLVVKGESADYIRVNPCSSVA